MNFSDVVMVYFIIGVVLVAGGVSPVTNGPVETFMDTQGDQVQVGDQVTEKEDLQQEDGGMLDNLLGSLQEGSDSVFGGGLIGAMANFVVGTLSIIGWPLAVTYAVGAPVEVQLFAGILVVAMTMGTGKVLRGSL